MLAGTVKFFNLERGYGFILPDGGGPEVFVHTTDLTPPLLSLASGQRVSYEIVDNFSPKGNGKKAAKVIVTGKVITVR